MEYYTVYAETNFSTTLHNLFRVLLNFEIIKNENYYFKQNNRELGPQTGTVRRSKIMWAILARSQLSCLIMREEECAFPKPPLFEDSLP